MVARVAVEHASDVADLMPLTSARPWIVALPVPAYEGLGAEQLDTAIAVQ